MLLFPGIPSANTMLRGIERWVVISSINSLPPMVASCHFYVPASSDFCVHYAACSVHRDKLEMIDFDEAGTRVGKQEFEKIFISDSRNRCLVGCKQENQAPIIDFAFSIFFHRCQECVFNVLLP